MLNSKEFAEALKQRYSSSPKSSVRNITYSVKNQKKEKKKSQDAEKSNMEKLEFFNSKKAKEGLPPQVRKKALNKIREKIRNKK